ncbi:hypothetical protein LQZ18_14965 [Lachnospiraceae bacterium ZAX-1]
MKKKKRDLRLVPIISTIGFAWITYDAGWYSDIYAFILGIAAYFIAMSILCFLKFKYWK